MPRRYRDLGWKTVGVEVDPGTAEATARRTGLPLLSGALPEIEVPSFDTLGFRVLGSRNLCFDPPHHVHFFTPRSMERMLLRLGFQPIGWSHFSMKYSPFITLQNALNLLPGEPDRLFASLRRTAGGRTILGMGITGWSYLALAGVLDAPAFAYSVIASFLGWGNTLRVYSRISGPHLE